MTPPDATRTPAEVIRTSAPAGTGRAGRTAFALVVLLSLVILFMPGDGVPTGLAINDKVVHGTLFAALAVTGSWAGLAWPPLAAGLLAYAGVSEVLQALLPISRDGTLGDGLADATGVVVGLVIVQVLRGRAGPSL